MMRKLMYSLRFLWTIIGLRLHGVLCGTRWDNRTDEILLIVIMPNGSTAPIRHGTAQMRLAELRRA